MTREQKHHAAWLLQFGQPVYVQLDAGPAANPKQHHRVRKLSRGYMTPTGEVWVALDDDRTVMRCYSAAELLNAYEVWQAEIVGAP